MAKESNNSSAAIHSSSISLLRERFRQLQRIKEMREEKELLRLITLAKAEQPRPLLTSTTTPYYKPAWFFHPELLHPSRPLRHPTPYLHLDSHGDRYPSVRCFEDKSLSWADKANMHAPAYSDEAVDVDTSLHL